MILLKICTGGILIQKHITFKIFFTLSSVVTFHIQTIDIFHAINHNYIKEIRTWVKSCPDTTVCDDQNQSVLHLAVLTGNYKIVKTILKSKVNVNLIDKHYKTALDYAVDYGYDKIAYLLVQHKAKVTTAANTRYICDIVQKERQKF